MRPGIVNQGHSYAVKLASWFCRQRSLRRQQRDDVFQDMLVGVTQALSRFDESRGVRFETFARKRLLGEAIDGLARRGGVPRSAWARGVRPPHALVDEIAAGRISDADIESSKLHRAYRILDECSPLLRRVIEAVYSESGTIADVAVETGLSRTLVRQFLMRGHQLLQSNLTAIQPTEMKMDAT